MHFSTSSERIARVASCIGPYFSSQMHAIPEFSHRLQTSKMRRDSTSLNSLQHDDINIVTVSVARWRWTAPLKPRRPCVKNFMVPSDFKIFGLCMLAVTIDNKKTRSVFVVGWFSWTDDHGQWFFVISVRCFYVKKFVLLWKQVKIIWLTNIKIQHENYCADYAGLRSDSTAVQETVIHIYVRLSPMVTASMRSSKILKTLGTRTISARTTPCVFSMVVLVRSAHRCACLLRIAFRRYSN